MMVGERGATPIRSSRRVSYAPPVVMNCAALAVEEGPVVAGGLTVVASPLTPPSPLKGRGFR